MSADSADNAPPWRYRLFPELASAAAGELPAQRRFVARVLMLFVTPALLYYGLTSVSLGYRSLALACGAGALLFFLVLVLGGRTESRLPMRVIVTAGITMECLALVLAEGHFSIAWAMPIPLLATLIFGRREGMFWSLLTLAALTTVLLNPTRFGVPADASWWPWSGAITDFVFAFALVAIASWAHDLVRENADRRMRSALDELSASETRMTQYMSLGTDLVFAVDAELRVTELSGRWTELTGIPTEDVIGLNFFEEAPSYARSGQGPMLALLRARQPVRDEPIMFTLEDGRELTLSVRMEPLFEDGVFQGYRGVSVDITDQVRAEAELRSKDAALRQAARMEAIGQLTSGVAHDFNNLLTVIQGNVELLQLGDEEDPAPQLAQVRQAAARASELTEKLLAFARRQALRPEAIEPAQLLDETAAFARRTLPENIEIRVTPDATVPACEADVGQLSNALLNLALNARDAMDRGGTLELAAGERVLEAADAAAAQLAPGRYVAFSVTDTGPGIAEEIREHVFEPFFTTKAVGEGTGLGLSTIYGFARQSGGSARIASTGPTGTCFELLLPATDRALQDEGSPVSEEAASARGRRVLVIEDEDGVRKLLTTMLERLGHDVIAAGTGPDGIEKLRDGGADLVISDVVLAGPMDGFSTLEALREIAPALPALLISGYSEAVFRDGRALPAGTDFLPKPFGLRDLKTRLATLID